MLNRFYGGCPDAIVQLYWPDIAIEYVILPANQSNSGTFSPHITLHLQLETLQLVGIPRQVTTRFSLDVACLHSVFCWAQKAGVTHLFKGVSKVQMPSCQGVVGTDLLWGQVFFCFTKECVPPSLLIYNFFCISKNWSDQDNEIGSKRIERTDYHKRLRMLSLMLANTPLPLLHERLASRSTFPWMQVRSSVLLSTTAQGWRKLVGQGIDQISGHVPTRYSLIVSSM